MAKKTKKQADGTEVDVETRAITVTGPQNGRWRAGLKFGPEPVTADVTEEQFMAIDADPLLKVTA